MPERLTNEELRKNFKNQFELVNYAIKLAENMIKTGRDARVKGETQNRAMQILDEITYGKDIFEEIPEPEVIVEAGIEVQMSEGEEKNSKGKSVREAMIKIPNSKKGRRVLVD